MEKMNKGVEKICNFYVSDLHLVTMILPYINQELNEKANIITFLEKELLENIELLTSKLNLKNTDKILKINWKETLDINYLELTKKLAKSKEGYYILLIKGSKNYIDTINKNLNEIFKNQFKNKFIKVINCYEVTDFNYNIKEILKSHKKVLNTSGEKYISEIFEGYEEAEEMC